MEDKNEVTEMIYVFIIACIATLIKAYRDRETFLYNNWIEYILFWIGGFVIMASAKIMADWIFSI